MNLKKIVLSIAIAAFVMTSALSVNAKDNAYISQYKAQNYLGCIQTTENILAKNPSDSFALYYQGLAYSQLGKTSKAIEAFDKVVTLNGNSAIVSYALKGKACATSPEACAKFEEQTDDFEQFINSKKFYTEKVQSEINQKKLDKIRQDINETVKTGDLKSEAPSNEEIANAVKTLAKVGFNPMNGMNMMQSPEMMQMSMLLGDNSNNNNMNNMLPYFLMSQNTNGSTKMSPELIQTMMMSQMQMY